MTLVQLRHFVCLAEHNSYVRASALLFLTQPALTRSIQALEEELGHPLFDRIGRRIELTAFGRDTLDHAARLIHDAEVLKQSGNAASGGAIGRIRIGLGSGPGAILSTPLLLHVAQNHPQLQLNISRGDTEPLLASLRERTIDAAIVDIRSMRPASDVEVSLQVEMRAAFLCRLAHPLHQRGEPVSIDDILRYPIASPPLSNEVARILTERYGGIANPDKMVTLRCDDTPSLIALARQSDTVVLTIEAAGEGLKPLPITPPIRSGARFGMVTLSRRATPPALSIVKTVMQQYLHD